MVIRLTQRRSRGMKFRSRKSPEFHDTSSEGDTYSQPDPTNDSSNQTPFQVYEPLSRSTPFIRQTFIPCEQIRSFHPLRLMSKGKVHRDRIEIYNRRSPYFRRQVDSKIAFIIRRDWKIIHHIIPPDGDEIDLDACPLHMPQFAVVLRFVVDL